MVIRGTVLAGQLSSWQAGGKSSGRVINFKLPTNCRIGRCLPKRGSLDVCLVTRMSDPFSGRSRTRPMRSSATSLELEAFLGSSSPLGRVGSRRPTLTDGFILLPGGGGGGGSPIGGGRGGSGNPSPASVSSAVARPLAPWKGVSQNPFAPPPALFPSQPQAAS